MADAMMDTEIDNSSLLDVTPNKDGGIMKEIVVAGSGESPGIGDTVYVHYVGTLESDGSKFDSSRDRGEYFDFQLGKGAVIKGWDLGVASMKKGELCRFTIRSEYAYGDSGSPPKIPGGATLVFEIELFKWTGEDLTEDKDGGITRSIIEKGSSVATPNDGAWVKIRYSGIHDGKTFAEETVDFTLGEGCEKNIPDGLEKALTNFTMGEKSKLKLEPQYGFGLAGNMKYEIPPNAALEYTVELLEFEKVKDVWELSPQEKVNQAKIHKEKGTNYFKDGKYKLAINQYSKVTELVSIDSGLEEEEAKESKAVRLAGHLNLAMCYLKVEDFLEAKSNSTKAIEEDSKSVKGYFRRGQAFQKLDELDASVQDFKKCLQLDATNVAAKKQLAVCADLIKKHQQREKQLYSGMFDKFAKADINKSAAARKNGVLKDGVGEWDDNKKEKKVEVKEAEVKEAEVMEAEEDLSDIKLLSSGEEIKAGEFMSTS